MWKQTPCLPALTNFQNIQAWTLTLLFFHHLLPTLLFFHPFTFHHSQNHLNFLSSSPFLAIFFYEFSASCHTTFQTLTSLELQDIFFPYLQVVLSFVFFFGALLLLFIFSSLHGFTFLIMSRLIYVFVVGSTNFSTFQKPFSLWFILSFTREINTHLEIFNG